MRLEDIVQSAGQDTSSLVNNDLDIDSDDLKVQIKLKQLEQQRYASDTIDRKWLAIWTAAIVSLWLLLVIAILILNKILNIGLSDTVLVTLLGTTTINVLGLSFIVLRGHFQSSHTSSNPTENQS
ncbi:hypothetical protein ATE47_04240 [Chryseobacterium sp. IHB B 17019]|uniref:hypothetical protein n=1 Tax=Chryseobacterium sp. IHB B 17019 TaxID=1721091 RepID=UPI00071FD463|nr:hypothetical protein [Chryseobacterium sp. IHB B 17019]ALR29779.1 hypothetical protein ATE47_04240 [Chryseobacterium sp. IHB B 17019]